MSSENNDKIMLSENDIMSSEDVIIFSEHDDDMLNENDTCLNSIHSSEEILVNVMDKVIM